MGFTKPESIDQHFGLDDHFTVTASNAGGTGGVEARIVGAATARNEAAVAAGVSAAAAAAVTALTGPSATKSAFSGRTATARWVAAKNAR